MPEEYSWDDLPECSPQNANSPPWIRPLWQHIGQLEGAPQVVSIRLGLTGEIAAMYLDEFPPVETVVRSDLIEPGRITSTCDLVSYRSSSPAGQDKKRTGIFKASVVYPH